MMKRIVLATALTIGGSLLLLVNTMAQQPAPRQDQRGPAPGTPDSAAPGAPGVAPTRVTDAAALSRTDAAFVEEATQGGLAEVELGTLAQQQAGSDAVRQFGERMARDHSQANNKLLGIAQAHDMTPSMTLAPKHKALRDRLVTLRGAEFDREYMAAMVADHQEDIRKFEAQAKSGNAQDVKQFAQETLPVLKEHLQLATSVQGKLGK